ncbi:MAG: hypothetical protein ACK5KP_07370 [Paludibacteraceae bacterium]
MKFDEYTAGVVVFVLTDKDTQKSQYSVEKCAGIHGLANSNFQATHHETSRTVYVVPDNLRVGYKILSRMLYLERNSGI